MSLKTFTHIERGRDLTVEEQGQFSNLMKSSIWVLKIETESCDDIASGVCIDSTGYILTAFAVKKSNATILGREINSSGFQPLKIIKKCGSMFILEPINKKEGYDYASALDDSIQVGECQEVYSIVQEASGIYSFAVGEVSHRKRVIEGIMHFQVANIHTRGRSDIVFSSTGHVMGIVVQKLSQKESSEVPDLGHNLVLHFSEINKCLRTFRPRVSRSKRH